MKANEIKELTDRISEWTKEQKLNSEIKGIEEFESCIEIKIQIKGTIIKNDIDRLTSKINSCTYFIYTIKENLFIDVIIDNPNKEIPF